MSKPNPKVYFVRASWLGTGDRIKIGYSKRLPERLYQLRCDFAPVELLASVHGDTIEEGLLHSAFSRFRIHGEWFLPHESILRTIALCKETGAFPAQIVAAAIAVRTAEAAAEAALRMRWALQDAPWLT